MRASDAREYKKFKFKTFYNILGISFNIVLNKIINSESFAVLQDSGNNLYFCCVLLKTS